MEGDNYAQFMEDIMNAFIKNFNRINETNMNMFHGIGGEEDTNDIMEEFFGHLHDFKDENNDRKIYTYSEDCDITYVLIINGVKLYKCQIFMPLIKYVATKLDWRGLDWVIKQL